MKEIRTLTAIETSNIVPMRKYDQICKTIVAISNIARALNAAQETNISNAIKCAAETTKYSSEIENKVGCNGYLTSENASKLKKKSKIPMSISNNINEWKLLKFSFVVFCFPKFRKVKVVPEVSEVLIKILEVMIMTKYDLLKTPSSLL